MMGTGARVVQRARRKEDKEERRRAIMRAARMLLSQRRFAEVKMIDVATEAELAKGTVFLYFPTKEALFLDLLAEFLAEWLTELNAILDGGKGRWSGVRVARVLTDTLVPRESFVQLLCLTTDVLEENVSFEHMVAFKRCIFRLMSATGPRLERRLSFFRPGQGMYFIMQVYAVVVGIKQLTSPGEIASKVLEDKELSVLRFDFATELRIMLTAVLRGIERSVSK